MMLSRLSRQGLVGRNVSAYSRVLSQQVCSTKSILFQTMLTPLLQRYRSSLDKAKEAADEATTKAKATADEAATKAKGAADEAAVKAKHMVRAAEQRVVSPKPKVLT